MTNHNLNIENNRLDTEHSAGEVSSGKKGAVIAVSAVLIAGLAAAGLYLVDFDQTKEARLPGVDVQVTEGQMPEFDVDVADVSVEDTTVGVEVPTIGVETETRTIEVEVPVDVDAGTKTETITVPTLNIEPPKEDNPANNSSD